MYFIVLNETLLAHLLNAFIKIDRLTAANDWRREEFAVASIVTISVALKVFSFLLAVSLLDELLAVAIGLTQKRLFHVQFKL